MVIALGAALGLGWFIAGCGGAFLTNNTAVRFGDIRVRFINATRYRAAFSFGTYDPLDRLANVGPAQQLRLENNSTSREFEITCRRSFVIGTEAFIQRAIAAGQDLLTEDFDADAFTSYISFSSAEADSPAAALPTRGTAEGVERLLGVDFSCEDLLIFTFVESADAPGGFRVDFQVLRDSLEGSDARGGGAGTDLGGGER
jgi:hypothetical protein